MTKFLINNRTDARKTDVNLLNDDQCASARPSHFFIVRALRDIPKKAAKNKAPDRGRVIIVASFYYNCPRERYIFLRKALLI